MADSRLEEAKRLASSGKLREAVSAVKAVLQSDPQDAEAKALMIEYQDRMMLDLQVHEKLRKVKTLLEEGKTDQAKKSLQEILRVAPENRESLVLLRALEQGGGPLLMPPQAEPALQEAESPFQDLPPFDAEPLPDLSKPAAPAGLDEQVLEPLAPLPPPPPPPAPAHEEVPEINFDTFEMADELSTAQRQQIGPTGAQLGAAEMAKVKQYIEEGHAFFDQGRYKDAIEVWTRIFIIDENNQEAQALIDQAKQNLNVSQLEVEHLLTEGVGAFNAQDYGKAQAMMEKILFTFPGHREAQFYLSRINEINAPKAGAPPAFEFDGPLAAQPAAAKADAGASEGGAFGGDFELDDDLTVPTGPEMRADGPPPEVGFQFESKPDEFSFAAVNPESAPPPAPSAFTWDEAPAPAPVTDLFGPAAGAPAAPAPAAGAPAPEFPGAPLEGPPDFFTPIAPPTAAQPAPLQSQAPPPFQPAAPPSPPQPAARPAVEEEAEGEEEEEEYAGRSKAGRGPSMMVLAGVAMLVVALGLGIFFGARYLFHSPEPTPAPIVTPKPKPNPKPTEPSNTAPQPNNPQPNSGEDLKAMGAEQLLLKARDATAAKDFKKAIALYQEVLLRDAVNPQAIQGLAAARTSLNQQEQENARNERFLKDYQTAVNTFQEQDYAESLRVSWRLIYPDDTLARQLGKREALGALIRAGYYNWAVMNLRSENLNDAQKNLQDLLEFDRSDADAQKLMQFVKRAKIQGTDQTYREAVKNIQYRAFSESP